MVGAAGWRGRMRWWIFISTFHPSDEQLGMLKLFTWRRRSILDPEGGDREKITTRRAPGGGGTFAFNRTKKSWGEPLGFFSLWLDRRPVRFAPKKKKCFRRDCHFCWPSSYRRAPMVCILSTRLKAKMCPQLVLLLLPAKTCGSNPSEIYVKKGEKMYVEYWTPPPEEEAILPEEAPESRLIDYYREDDEEGISHVPLKVRHHNGTAAAAAA